MRQLPIVNTYGPGAREHDGENKIDLGSAVQKFHFSGGGHVLAKIDPDTLNLLDQYELMKTCVELEQSGQIAP